MLVAFTVATVFFAIQARKFEVDASADTLLMRDNVNYIHSRIDSLRFAPQEFLLVAYQPRDNQVFSEATFSELRSLSEQLQTLDRVESVRSMLNVPLPSQVIDGIDTGADLDIGNLTAEDLNMAPAALAEVFAGHPIYENLLVNEAQTATALQVLFRGDPQIQELEREIVNLQQISLDRELTVSEQEDLAGLEASSRVLTNELNAVRLREIETVREFLNDYELQAELYLGGVHVLAFQLVNIIRSDLLVFGLAVAGMIGLVLFLAFRQWRWVLIPLVTCAVSVTLTVGLFGMLGLRATVISANFIALQLILTLALVVHLVVQYREYQAANSGWDKHTLVSKTLERKITPSIYAGFTTSVGFASLLLSGIQPVISFGWMMVIAVVVSIAVSLLLFPALLLMLPHRQGKREGKLLQTVLGSFASLSVSLPGGTILMSILVLALSLFGISRLTVENSFINYFDESTDVYRELMFIDREMGGSTPLDIIYTLDETENSDDLVMTAETVQMLQRMHAAIEGYEAAGKLLSVVNFTELASEINQDRPLTEFELTAVYRMLDESLREELLSSFYSPDHNQVRINVRVQDSVPGLNREQFIMSLSEDMDRIVGDRGEVRLSSLFVLYQDILERLYRSQIVSIGAVYLGLALAFLTVFRSVRLTLIGIAPNMLATSLVLGAMGWLNIPLDLMTITIASIAMGIAADDTIHYLHRFQDEQKDRGTADAIRHSHRSVGVAVLYTSLIITLGFAMLAFSDFVPSALFGILTGLAMLSALLANLGLLPSLLQRFGPRMPAGETA